MDHVDQAFEDQEVLVKLDPAEWRCVLRAMSLAVDRGDNRCTLGQSAFGWNARLPTG